MHYMLLLLFVLAPNIACGYIDFGVVPSSSAAAAQSDIIFATVTPRPQTSTETELSEGQMTEEASSLVTFEPAFEDGNELGKIMILEYHRIGYPETRYQRTPENFRADIQRLYEAGYTPVNFYDVLQGLSHLAAGQKPVVLTFDDSDISQFRVLDDNTIDADSAVGILLDFHNQHPIAWPTRATFFVLGNDVGEHVAIFGQSSRAKAKLQFLVDNGIEIGSHTVNHVDLSVATSERIYWELAVSKKVIEDLVPGYTVQTLSMPYGGFPDSLDFLKSGNWEEYQYSYVGNVAAWGGPTVSPFDPTFEPYKVSRIEVTSESFDQWLTYFEQNPHEYYISDGDPSRVSTPETATDNQP